jgi:two-component system, chemotaxis family, sensor kinase Cph1
MNENQVALDLTNCDREPIHIPGAIQPHGVLLALVEPELSVLQVSANLSAKLGLPIEATLRSPLEAVFGRDRAGEVRKALDEARAGESSRLCLVLGGTRFDGLVHRHQGLALLELEPTDPGTAPQWPHQPLHRAIVRLQSAAKLQELCDAVVSEVRKLTGFDRVMVYQFDEDGHGVVRAELKEDELEPYLGLHYPASDIPRQARELYLKNWIRIIPEARYTRCELVPSHRPDTGAPLDLSFCILRSVSPIHLEYLANMGVRASMSVSIVVRERLWGLVSCINHRAPRAVPASLRADCEVLARLTSLQISALEDREIALRRTARKRGMQALAESMGAGDEVLGALLTSPVELLGLVEGAGASVVHAGEVSSCGNTPSAEAVRAIGDFIDRLQGDTVFSTQSLALELPEAARWKDVASGVLSFGLPGQPPRRLLWFKPEILQTVSWGGDPRKPVDEQTPAKLHPRRSFASWREEVRLRSVAWTPGNLEAAEDLRRRAIEIDLEKQVRRAHSAVQARDDLVAVVSHDLKNPLNVVQLQATLLRTWAKEDTGERAQRLRAVVDRLQRSIDRMDALIHDLLDLAKIEAGRFVLRRTVEPVTDVVEETLVILGPLADAKRIQLKVEQAPDLTIELDRERIFQVLSNLVGNAIKFTPEEGRVAIRVALEQGSVVFSVTDSGPGVSEEHVDKLFHRYWQAPARGRLGSGLGLYIAKGIVEAHGGRIWVQRSSAGGASFHFTLPASPRERRS